MERFTVPGLPPRYWRRVLPPRTRPSGGTSPAVFPPLDVPAALAAIRPRSPAGRERLGGHAASARLPCTRKAASPALLVVFAAARSRLAGLAPARWLRALPQFRKWRWHGTSAATGYPTCRLRCQRRRQHR